MIRQLMPWQATGPHDVTVLTARDRLLTKRITPETITEYDHETVFAVRAYRLDGIADLAALLGDLASDPKSAIIRGALRPEAARIRYVLRRYASPPEQFAPAARAWLMLDCDGAPAPSGVDPVDQVLVGGVLRRALPSAFHQAAAVVQLSATAGLKASIVKAHLWFWCDRPLTDGEAKRLLDGVAVDTSVFTPVALHYTAAPILDGVDDPCINGRLAVLPGYAEVVAPALPEPVRPAHPRLDAAPVEYVAPERGLSFEATRAERYMLGCLTALARTPAKRGRLRCMKIAVDLFGLAKAGALDAADITGRIKGVMLKRGWANDETIGGRHSPISTGFWFGLGRGPGRGDCRNGLRPERAARR